MNHWIMRTRCRVEYVLYMYICIYGVCGKVGESGEKGGEMDMKRIHSGVMSGKWGGKQ